MALYDTVANIVSEVAVECGLDAVSDVYASTDKNIIQMRTLLKSTGRKLVLKYPWLQTIKEHTFATTSATGYNLPTDFLSMVDGSAWNRTSDRQVHPMSPQEWQRIKAVDTGITLATLIKPRHMTLEIHSPTSGETIAFEYRSYYWVAVTGSTTPTKTAPTLNTDVIILDAELVKAALRLAFLAAKGFDTAMAAVEFRNILADLQAGNVGASPTLSLNGPKLDDRFLDSTNAPDSGYGFDGFGGLF